jgi:hypothetical protein
MSTKELTFNDLPTVVNQLCEQIANLESMMEMHFANAAQKKENTHVPMTREEVCAYLGGITKSSFYHKVKYGGLPVVKQGKRLLVYRDDLDKWLESGRKGEKPMSIEEEHEAMRSTIRRRPKPLNF